LIESGASICNRNRIVTGVKFLFRVTLAEKVNALALARLESKKKGILLLHDIHGRTAKALPALLRELKKGGIRVVHVVPASGAVANIDVKPDEKSAANTDEKTAAANQEPNAAEKVKQVTPVNLDKKSPKNSRRRLVSKV
jgi:nickel-dependent lactate racemase